MRELSGRVAVVTGGASGIGLALATRFVDAGMQVVHRRRRGRRRSRRRPTELGVGRCAHRRERRRLGAGARRRGA